MYRPSVILRTAEVIPSGRLLIQRHMQGVIYQLVDAFIFCRGNGNHRNPEGFLHGVDIDRAAVSPNLVHHIKSQHHGNIQFHKLHGQVEIPLDIGSVHNIDNSFGFFPDNKLSGNNFLAGIGRKRINTGQIGNQCVRLSLYLPALSVYGHAGKIPHVLVGACKLVK